ncbi:MAG TPA: LPXTG cell wall anchor domain-containing protein [Acidimicrobiia bacterium]
MTPLRFLKRSAAPVIMAASIVSGLVATAHPAVAQVPPTFTIIKDTQPDQGQDFTFTASGPNLPGDGIFLLDDDGVEDNALPSSQTFTLAPNPEGSGLDPYVITEELVDGFELTDIDCTLNGEPQDLADIQVLNDEDELIGISGRLDLDDVAVCTFVNEEEADSDPYDTYDDDPGDRDFQFDTPFQNADNDPAPVEVAATSQPVVNQQPEQSQVPVVVAGEVAPALPADAAPVALTELPRTGSGTRGATMVGGLLLILGGVASLAGRRRKATQA